MPADVEVRTDQTLYQVTAAGGSLRPQRREQSPGCICAQGSQKQAPQTGRLRPSYSVPEVYVEALTSA